MSQNRTSQAWGLGENKVASMWEHGAGMTGSSPFNHTKEINMIRDIGLSVSPNEEELATLDAIDLLNQYRYDAYARHDDVAWTVLCHAGAHLTAPFVNRQLQYFVGHL